MRTPALALSVVPLALAVLYGVQQDSSKSALEGRVELLEQRLESVEGYLQEQAAISEELEKAIDEAVTDGYTHGINWGSRKTLVAAWKKQIKTATTNVPGAKAGAKPSVSPHIRRREEDIRRREEVKRAVEEQRKKAKSGADR